MTGRQKIDWAYQHMPVLAAIRADFERRKPLKDIGIGVCLHLTKETAVLIETLQAGGAHVAACASNPLSTQDDVVKALSESGNVILGKHGETVTEYQEDLETIATCAPTIVIDDGGDLTRLIHSIVPNGKLPLGGLEETTTGINVIKQMNLRYPILDVNGADTKHLFDNVYGTGQSVIDAIMRATNDLLAGKTFVIAGYGNCGRGLAARAKGMGCTVIVTEVDPIKALQAMMDGFEVMQMNDAVFIADIIVTVTGNKDVLVSDHFYQMKDGVILANAGHFDVEINVQDLILESDEPIQISKDITQYTVHHEKGQVRIYLLSEGRLVNLAAAEGHPSAVMDMSFSNQALGVEYLLNKYKELKPGVHQIPKEIDVRVANLKLQATAVKIDELTAEQKKYLGLN